MAVEQVHKEIIGQQDAVQYSLIGLVAGGHVLLEGAPGLGKTRLVKTISRIFNLKFSRIQFTPDLMPADILGTNILSQNERGERSFAFQAGPIFGNIVLADEVNRGTPKTQSALLEAMEERAVTIQGNRWPLPAPFFVMATQNPIEMEGVYPLPEAQLDRFMFKIEVHAPPADEMRLIMDVPVRELEQKPLFKADDLLAMQRTLARVPVPNVVKDYVVRIVSRHAPDRGRGAERDQEVHPLRSQPPWRAVGAPRRARLGALVRALQRLGHGHPAGGRPGLVSPRDPELRGRGRERDRERHHRRAGQGHPRASRALMAESLLEREFLSRLEYLHILTRELFIGHGGAERLSKKFGVGVEFADHRTYTAGDDFRYVDWAAFAKRDDVLIKLFTEEQALPVYILLDASNSMAVGRPEKLFYAKKIAAALGYISIANLEHVTILPFDETLRSRPQTFHGRGKLQQMLSFLEDIRPGNATQMGTAVKTFVHRFAAHRGVVIILSDYLDRTGYEETVRLLHYHRFE